jgi:NADH-ubiquinone oxidoreductase chain 6
MNEKSIPNIMYAASNCWDGNLTDTTHISSIGNILYTSYNIWLLISGIILLLSMVGCIMIVIKPEKV